MFRGVVKTRNPRRGDTFAAVHILPSDTTVMRHPHILEVVLVIVHATEHENGRVRVRIFLCWLWRDTNNDCVCTARAREKLSAAANALPSRAHIMRTPHIADAVAVTGSATTSHSRLP